MLPRVTTTVEVREETGHGYLSTAPTGASLDGTPPARTPVSVSVITRGLLNDQQARLLSDVIKNDASVGEDYAPVGYYGDYQIRGFPIDLASALRINGLTIAGEQDVPLENKQSVEIVKGIAGVESGVANAGGMINFVTKRPAPVKAMELATDHRGGAFGAADLGWISGGARQLGTRLNLAGERIASYVNGADGWRAMGAGAADWRLSPRALLKSDLEYQHKVERSVSGYQLLGGTTVPNLGRIHPSTMLGEQSWAKPNTFDAINTGARLDYDLGHSWRAFAAAGLSRSLIDDNVVYAYGCAGSPLCTDLGGTAPDYFFAPDGGYSIYDYRDPGELRIDAEAEALVLGRAATGAVRHNLAAGVELFRRSVRQPGYYTEEDPASPDGVVQDGAVYAYIGSDNIYQPVTPLNLAAVESPHQSAGPARLYDDDHQSALLLEDRILLPGRIELLASGRYTSLRDHNDSARATDPEAAPLISDTREWLPQFAVTFQAAQELMLYANYGVLLSLGPQAPFWVDDSSQFLSPYRTRQAEAGLKYQPGQRILLTTALFRMRAPFFYPRVLQAPDSTCTPGVFQQPGDLCFEADGRETHDGLEISAQGRAAGWLEVHLSAAGLAAISDGSATPAFNDRQVINAPRVRTVLFADVAVPHVRGLHLMPGWSYTGSKEATRDDAVGVGGYNLLNLGARYTPGGEGGRLSLRLYADNVLDKRYWKDTGASLGDTFLHLGAPTTVRLSARYTF